MFDTPRDKITIQCIKIMFIAFIVISILLFVSSFILKLLYVSPIFLVISIIILIMLTIITIFLYNKYR